MNHEKILSRSPPETAPGAEEISDASMKSSVKVSRLTLVLGVLVVLGLTLFVVLHVGEMERFAVLLSQAKPEWLILAFALQLATYLCAGRVWYEATRSAERRVPVSVLARLSVEQLSINQVIPTAGISGNLLIFQALKRRGLPGRLIMQALGIEIISNYFAYGIVTLLAVIILFFFGSITKVIGYALGIFALLIAATLGALFWFLRHEDKPLPRWLCRFGLFSRGYEVLKQISGGRILNARLLLTTSALNVAIFVLDGGTLWAMMYVGGAPVLFAQAFVTVVIAFIAGAISFLPGGLGGFEAASVAMLNVCGAPIEAALAGTLLFRGLTLWVPLLPGLILARQDVEIRL